MPHEETQAALDTMSLSFDELESPLDSHVDYMMKSEVAQERCMQISQSRTKWRSSCDIAIQKGSDRPDIRQLAAAHREIHKRAPSDAPSCASLTRGLARSRLDRTVYIGSAPPRAHNFPRLTKSKQTNQTTWSARDSFRYRLSLQHTASYLFRLSISVFHHRVSGAPRRPHACFFFSPDSFS